MPPRAEGGGRPGERIISPGSLLCVNYLTDGLAQQPGAPPNSTSQLAVPERVDVAVVDLREV